MDKSVTGKVKLPPVAQIGMVVKDIDKVIDFYSKTFGIGPWVVKEGEYSALEVRGKVYAAKTKVAFTKFGPVQLELFQVREGHMLQSEFPDRGREGVHHLGFIVSQEEKARMIAELEKSGIKVLQDAKRENSSCAFLDTEEIGGLFFEIIEIHE